MTNVHALYVGQKPGRIMNFDKFNLVFGVCQLSNPGSNTCESCPANSGSFPGASIESDCLADAGFSGSGESVEPCSGGTYKTESLSDAPCTPCDSGYFGSGRECTNCPANSNTGNATGSAMRTSCVANTGYFGPSGDIPTRCPNNSGAGGATITDCECDPGFLGPNGEPCTACLKGHYKLSAGPAPCKACLHSTFQDEGAAH